MADRPRSSEADDDVVFAPSTIAPLTAMRSTVIVSSRAAMHDAGYFERYAARLSPSAASALDHAIAGVWLPLPVVLDHYVACDALRLALRVEVTLGAAAAMRSVNALVGTAIRLAATAGSTPWGFLEQVGRYWNRGYEGSGLRVVRRGPKEALLVVVDNAVHQRSAFARHTFCGFSAEMMKPFVSRFFMRVDAVSERAPWTVRYVLQWV